MGSSSRRTISLPSAMRKRTRLGSPARLMTEPFAIRVAVGCLVVVLGVGTWTVARAADDPGEQLYDGHCRQCHGPEGRGRGTAAPALVPFDWSYEEALRLVRRPVCDMPPIPESA